MSTDDIVKLVGASIAAGVMSFGAGSYQGDEDAQQWCGEALSLQAQHYNQQLVECEQEIDECEEQD